jgi:hypothetical protein
MKNQATSSKSLSDSERFKPYRKGLSGLVEDMSALKKTAVRPYDETDLLLDAVRHIFAYLDGFDQHATTDKPCLSHAVWSLIQVQTMRVEKTK